MSNGNRTLQASVALFVALLMAGGASAQIVPLPDTPEEVTLNVPFTGAQTVYADDFNDEETTWSGTTGELAKTTWEWGSPASGPAVAASGNNVWGTGLAGAYSNYECSALLSPPLTIPAGATAGVSFKEWRHFESSATLAWDAALLFVTENGLTYTKVTPDTGYTSPGISTTARTCLLGQPSGTSGLSGPAGATPPAPAYSAVGVDLSSQAGKTVRVALAFGADGITTRDGWYIDDFVFTVNGTTAISTDFESDDGGFEAIDFGAAKPVPKGWSWGVPTVGPDPGPGAFAMWATDAHGDHGLNECSFIESDPIDLGLVGGSNAFVEWRQWFRANFGVGGVVQVGHEGTYTNLVPVGGYGVTNPSSSLDGCLEHVAQQSRGFAGTLLNQVGDPLKDYSADISPWLGKTVTLRFVFAARPVTTTPLPGWYVDDVRIVAGVGGQSHTQALPAGPAQEDTRVFQPVATAYAEDFNFDDAETRWTQTGTGAWQWGTAESPPEHLPGSIGMWGTSLYTDYNANECSRIASPSFTLPAADPAAGITLAQVSLNVWRYTERLYDGAQLVISTDDGLTWQRVIPNDGYDTTLSTSSLANPTKDCLGIGSGDPVWTGPSSAPAADEWLNVTADLTPWMGHEVRIGVAFGSEASGERRGVYVDNVIVQLGAGASSTAFSDCPEPAGWRVTGNNPTWCYGVPTSGPQSQRPVWATNLHGTHGRGECSAIEYGPVDTSLVPGLGTLNLNFNHFMRTSTTGAGGVVQVSDDGGITWDIVTPVGAYDRSLGTTPRGCLAPGTTSQAGFAGAMTDYEQRQVRLQAYQGKEILVRFAFGSSTGTPDLGWYVRSVSLDRGAGNVPLTPMSAPPTPSVLPLMEKADDALRMSIRNGQVDALEMLVVGPPHQGIREGDFATRAEARAHLDALAAPFFARVTEIAAETGAEVVGTWSAGPVVRLRGDLTTALRVAAEGQTQAVEEDGPDKVRLVDPIEEDPLAVQNSQGRKMLEAEDIWAAGFRGEGIAIAVIDTGVDATHEAFFFADGTSRLGKWANCITPTSQCDTTGTPIDDHGHGTHVSGTALGSSEYEHPSYGAFQEAGVAPAATLFGVKFLSGSGSGSFADGIKALEWSFDNGADITSNSWGSSCSSGASSVIQTVNALTAAGMLNVFAAGNSGPGAGTIGSPACADGALSVGAVDANYNIASFSSRGPCSDPTTGTGPRICPDLVAKGVAVRSAIPRSGASQSDPSGYKTWQGTSMATPHVAGAAALIEQMKRHFTGGGWDTTNQAEKEVFKMTSLDLGAPGPDNTYGWGHPKLLNIYALLNATDEANVVSAFGISQPVVRLGDSTMLSFSIRNLGGAAATGDFLATLEAPDGAVTTLRSSTVTLSLLDGEAVTHVVTVGGDLAPGTYTFRGTFDYSWVGPDNQTVIGSIAHVGTFDVKRVFLEFTVDGLAPTAGPLELQTVTVTGTNIGNEDAQAVEIEFTVPKAYLFVPGSGYAPTIPRSEYADPAPDAVHDDKNFNRVTLIYDVGSLPEGGSFSFTTQLLPKELGRHTFIGAASFEDGAGNGFSQGKAIRQTVALPAP